jgi:hypothetical protein
LLVVTPELSDGLVVWFQTTHQPDKGYIMVTFPLQLSGTFHSVGIAINQQLEHGSRIVFRIADFIGIDFYTQQTKIKSFYKEIISSDGIVFAYILFYALGALNPSDNGRRIDIANAKSFLLIFYPFLIFYCQRTLLMLNYNTVS